MSRNFTEGSERPQKSDHYKIVVFVCVIFKRLGRIRNVILELALLDMEIFSV